MSSPPESEIRGDHALQSRDNRVGEHAESRAGERKEEYQTSSQIRTPASPPKVRDETNGASFNGYHESQLSLEAPLDGDDLEEFGDFVAEELPEEQAAGSPQGSLSIPDDTPSVQVRLIPQVVSIDKC